MNRIFVAKARVNGKRIGHYSRVTGVIDQRFGGHGASRSDMSET